MAGEDTRWVATVSGSGIEAFEIVADSREELEQLLGDMVDLHVGRPRWTIAERSRVEPSERPDAPPVAGGQQLGLDL